MKELDKLINKHCKNSYKLKRIYLSGYSEKKKINYEKSQEIMKQQNEEWKKLQFFKNLKREMEK